MSSLAAAATNCRCSRVVFVGNIPYHASEAELRDACELIGPIRSLRLAADPATGKRKGYAFVEYPDDETARSACRNLGGHPLRGRELRVGLAGRHHGRGQARDPGGQRAHRPRGRYPRRVPRLRVPAAARSRHEVPGGAVAAGAAGDGGRAGGRRGTRHPEAARGARPRAGCRHGAGVRHLLDMAAADEAAVEEAKSKKRAAAEEPNDVGDRRAKVGKVEYGGFKDRIAVSSAAGVSCF